MTEREQLLGPRFLAEQLVLLSTETEKRSSRGKDRNLKQGAGCNKLVT